VLKIALLCVSLAYNGEFCKVCICRYCAYCLQCVPKQCKYETILVTVFIVNKNISVISNNNQTIKVMQLNYALCGCSLYKSQALEHPINCYRLNRFLSPFSLEHNSYQLQWVKNAGTTCV